MAWVRRDVWTLGNGWNDTLLWYARGVRVLQARPLTDQTSWWFLAALHGFHPAVWQNAGVLRVNDPLPPPAIQNRFFNQCQHQTWYFLPWHRGYLAAFEEIVRGAVIAAGGPSEWALPYWNYSDPARPGTRKLPDAFASPSLPDGSPNPLRVQRRYGSGSGPIVLDPRVVRTVHLRDTVFEGGENDIPPGFGGPRTAFHHGPESQTTNGGLESEPHNTVHGAVGGSAPGRDPRDWRNLGLMSMPITAGLDPIFWLHHANIDRLWSVWLRDRRRTNPRQAAWLDGPAGRAFVMPRSDGSTWTFTARDVLDTSAPPFDYSYDDDLEAPVVERRVVQRMANLGLAAPAAEAVADEEAVMSARPSPELIGSSEEAVTVAGTTSASVRLDRQGAESLRTSLFRALEESAPVSEPARVFLKLEGIHGTADAALYHVYVELPADADPEENADRFAGTLSLFGVSAAADPDGPNAGSGINQVLEITEIVDALQLSGERLAELNVRFVPANETVAEASFSIDRVSVYKLGE